MIFSAIRNGIALRTRDMLGNEVYTCIYIRRRKTDRLIIIKWKKRILGLLEMVWVFGWVLSASHPVRILPMLAMWHIRFEVVEHLSWCWRRRNLSTDILNFKGNNIVSVSAQPWVCSCLVIAYPHSNQCHNWGRCAPHSGVISHMIPMHATLTWWIITVSGMYILILPYSWD